MRSQPDFSDALVSLDWADRQIDVLDAEFLAFTKTYPCTISTETKPDNWTLFYFHGHKAVAKPLSASVSAIIQAQRSSLDYMAVSLAEANGTTDPSETYFPVVKTVEGLSDKRTLKKIRLLHPSDQKRILDLKPYAGGNDGLYALHELNRQRKHRRLGVLGSAADFTEVGAGPGGAKLYELRTYGTIGKPNDRTLVAALRHEGDPYLKFALDVGFCDFPGTDTNPAVIPTLREFSTLCRGVAAYLLGEFVFIPTHDGTNPAKLNT